MIEEIADAIEELIEPSVKHYRIEHGDTLRRIAHAFYRDGDKWSVIFRFNKHYISDPNQLTPGQTIVIPHISGMMQ